MTSTRDRILDAAAHVMRTRGFARTTTKEIARAAGFSEATLYKHFQDKTDLFLAVLKERLPSLAPVLSVLETEASQDATAGDGTSAGDGTREDRRGLADRLAATARGAIAFYEASFPVSASIFSEPDLLAAHRAALARQGAGPHHPLQALARYLRLEQEHGHIRPGADCDAAAVHATAIATTLLAGLE